MADEPSDNFGKIEELTDDLLPEPFLIDDVSLAKIDRESEFLRISFELLKEMGHWLIILAGLATEPLDLNPAIIRGHTVRLAKLTRTMVREMIQDEPGQQLALVREIIETVATLAYLLGDTDGTRYTAYIQDGLVAEREMVKEITINVADRGAALDIENRMLRSIQSKAAAARIADVLTLPGRAKIGFPSAEDRIKLLGLNAYIAYRASSSEVHGTWIDLRRNHLEQVGDKFLPNLAQLSIRPQPPLAMAYVLVSVYTATLARHVEPQQIAFFEKRFEDLLDRTKRVDAAHEAWLQTV